MVTFDDVAQKVAKLNTYKERVAELEAEISSDLKEIHSSGLIDSTGRYSVVVKNEGGKKVVPNVFKLKTIRPDVYNICLRNYFTKCEAKASFPKTDLISAYQRAMSEANPNIKVTKVAAEQVMMSEIGEEEDAEEVYTLKDNGVVE